MGHHLSPSEQKLLSIVKRHRRPVTTKALVEKFYSGQAIPQYGQQTVSGLVRSLVNKQLVCRSKRCGPAPTEVWVE